MKFNFGTREKEGKTIPSGKFSFRNKEYTLDKNPIKFIIGGLITTSAFMFLFVGLIFVFGVFVRTFSNIIVKIISIILFITVLITILGVTKYAVTGNAQPFMKIETGDKRFSISYFNWD